MSLEREGGKRESGGRGERERGGRERGREGGGGERVRQAGRQVGGRERGKEGGGRINTQESTQCHCRYMYQAGKHLAFYFIVDGKVADLHRYGDEVHSAV